MEHLKNYIYKQVANLNLSQAEAKQLLLELKEKPQAHDDEIAVIGMSGRFPKAGNLKEYWENIKNGEICIGKLPKDRIRDIEDFLLKFHYRQLVEENAIREDGHLDLNYEIRGYLDEIDKFDAAFFGIPPREARTMDPDQRMFLEVAYEAIEDAGYCGDRMYGTNTGVFVGIDHVSDMKYKQLAASDPMVVTGTWPGILASRISYIYNFHGPSLVIDTACSSGLVSVHMACNSLKSGECDMAVAGGLSSFYYRPMKFKDELKELDSVEAKDNMVKTFDKKANGTVWGEGVGAVLLKPLSKALADGDVIHAVIKASAINNDGASNGITAPDAGAQESLLLSVWKKAGINPETVGYIEAHGTGTVLGDPIEVKAMTNAFRAFTDKKQFCGIGSVKTSIGHLVGASGLASLLKVIMMLKTKSIPASLNFTEPNPYINFSDSPVYVNDRLIDWENGEDPRRAGINSFGFSGTNCHVVLEEAPKPLHKAKLAESEFEVFTLSAKNQNVLIQMINEYKNKFNTNQVSLQDACYTVNTGRGHYNCRVVLMVKDFEDLREKIDYLAETNLNDINKFGIYYGEHRIAPDNKTVREKGEITEAERRKLSRTAAAKLEELVQKYSYPTAAELCDLYVKGAKVEWEHLYKGQNRRRLNLPVYPLERMRCWYEEKSSPAKEMRDLAAKKTKEITHPLVDRCLAESLYQDIYVTEFSSDRHWVIKDHKILGSYVIPGTTYIEMAIEVCRKYYGSSVEIKDVIYFSPVIVDEKETREVHSILVKQKDHIEVTFASRINAGELNEQWIKHVECKVCKAENTPEKVYDIEAIKKKLLSENQEDKLIDMTPRESAIQLGERWQNERVVAVGRSEALVELELPEHIAYDIGEFCLHVSMLDNAVNAVSQKVGKGLYLPFFYKNIKVTGKMRNKFYSYIRVNEKTLKGMETVTFDVSLMDGEGRVFADVSDYSIKKVNETEYKMREMASKGDVYFGMGWTVSESSGNEKDLGNSNVIVFKDKTGFGDSLVERLQSEGCNVIEAETGSGFEKLDENKYLIGGEEDDYRRLIEEMAGRNITSVLHMMTLSGGREAKTFPELEEKQKLGIYSLFYLVKALVAGKFSKDINIVLISDYANEVTKSEKILDPANAAFLGMGRIIPLEHSNLKCKCIDIDEGTEIENIIRELKTDDTFRTAYRNGKRFIEEFRKLELGKESENKLDIKENGVYVITGGTGGLGLEMGKYLASGNKVKIAFVNRSKMPARETWNEILEKNTDKKLCRAIASIREMEQSGCEVGCYSADVSDYEEMRTAIGSIKADYGSVNGIIHCAGVAGDGFMMRKSREAFDKVVSPKVKGTWILDDLTSGDNIDFLVMFSSILSIFGDPGQGDYTAANSYMDVYAAYRQRKGKRTAAINWPAWKDTGMAVDYGIREEDTTVKPISTRKAIRAFEDILESGSARVMPGDLNYSKLMEIKDELPFRLSDQIENVLEKQKLKLKPEDKVEVPGESSDKALIRGRGEEDYNETENRLAQIWSRVLGLNEIDIFDNFSSLGGDSMMAIQLLKEVNKVFEGAIDISDIFSYPSVQQMSEYIDEKLGRGKERKKALKEKDNVAEEDKVTDEKLKNLLDGLESGETSVENALRMLDSD